MAGITHIISADSSEINIAYCAFFIKYLMKQSKNNFEND